MHAEACGGCPLIHLSYPAQLAHKHGRVSASRAAYVALAPTLVQDVVPAEPRAGYRTRAKLMVAAGGRVGLFAKEGDHAVVDTPGCVVLAPALARVVAELRARFAQAEAAGGGAPLAPPNTKGGPGLIAVDLRELRPPPADAATDTTGQPEGLAARVLVTWVIRRGPSFRLEAFRLAATAFCEALPEVLGVAVNFHEGDSPQVLGDETLVLVGKSWGLDSLGASTHRATFGSFVQAHRGQAARVHAMVAEAVFGDRPDDARVASAAPRVLDLYGGSGAIALGLAARGAEVLMVEAFAPAVQQALESARASGIALKAERADVADALRRLARRGALFDVAVVNPPRRGLDPVVRARLGDSKVDTVVYVSCNPETLVRDLDHLARLGLVTTKLAPLDMIPQTEEVETVVVLRRSAGVVKPRVVFEDRDVVVVDKPPHEPTTPQGEYRDSLLARVLTSPGLGGAVPVHRLDVGTSGVVVFAKAPSQVASWSQAMQAVDARKVYMAAVRGVPEARGVVDHALVIDGKTKPSVTRFERSSQLAGHAILNVSPDEGRTHQIRRHLASIGHPILGDDRYGHAATNRFFFEKHGLDRPFLHAARLELTHPRTGNKIVFEAPLPGDLVQVVCSLSRPSAVQFRERAPGPVAGSRSVTETSLRRPR